MSNDRTVSEKLQRIAEQIDRMLLEASEDGKPIAFTLFVFTHPRASYISNANRDDTIPAIRELLDLWEQGMPDIPTHELDG